MDVLKAVSEAGERLKKSGIEEYRLEAGLFMAAALEKDRMEIMSGGVREISEEQMQRFEKMIERRLCHEPAAYILGHREFMGLNFRLNPDVLIPRPDTETLVETAIRIIEEKHLETLAEVGVGSGCISISIAKYTKIKCFGTDISAGAVKAAEFNAALNGVNERVSFFQGDIFEGLPEQKYDIIVSNPPYIRKNDINGLMDDVKNFEPRIALDGGDDGLDFYRKITENAEGLLSPGGYILFEIGYDQGEAVSAILREHGFAVEIIRDLGSHDRVAVASKEDFDV